MLSRGHCYKLTLLSTIESIEVPEHLDESMKLCIFPFRETFIKNGLFLLKRLYYFLLSILGKRQHDSPSIFRRRFSVYISQRLELFDKATNRTSIHRS